MGGQGPLFSLSFHGEFGVIKKTYGFFAWVAVLSLRFSPHPPWVSIMRLIEEVYVKAEKDTICQTCGIDIPKDSNHLLETYVHQGNLLVSHYCLNKKCNPPNNVKKRLMWTFGIIVIIGAIALEAFNLLN